MDWIEARQEYDYAAYFHGCVPGRANGAAIVLGDPGSPRLAIIPPAGDALTPQPVQNAGRTAYLDEKKLDPARNPCFAYRRRAASTCLIWAIVPLLPNQPLPAVTRLPVSVNGKVEDDHGAAAVRVAFGGGHDLLCVSHKDFDADLSADNVQAFGHLFFRRHNPAGAPSPNVTHTMADGTCGR
jgi:hypothetical protein